uniref:PVII n=1 Tax=Amphisbaenian adenovirus 1 TaxID=1743020 RepID=A0A1B0TGP0_9ADEN|nr:pVII [Amphisbaenian adenovirus 1]
MSILISPSDNTGWGIGTKMMRATGVKFTRKEPVRVRPYYRAQWGQNNGRKSKKQLKAGLTRYKKLRVKRKRRGIRKLVRSNRHRAALKTDRIAKHYAARQAIREMKQIRQGGDIVLVDPQQPSSSTEVIVGTGARRRVR